MAPGDRTGLRVELQDARWALDGEDQPASVSAVFLVTRREVDGDVAVLQDLRSRHGAMRLHPWVLARRFENTPQLAPLHCHADQKPLSLLLGTGEMRPGSAETTLSSGSGLVMRLAEPITQRAPMET